jgi:formylglycine-generating enzyme required for sulfatase activity
MKKLNKPINLILVYIFTILCLVSCNSGKAAEPPSQPPAASPTVSLPTNTPVPTAVTTPTLSPIPEIGTSRTREIDGMTMVYVPAGSFLMGSKVEDEQGGNGQPYPNEFPEHEVSVGAFWLDQTEVTNAQYQGCVEVGKCDPPKVAGSHSREAYYGEAEFAAYPVINITWYQAVAYCSWVGGRLPTEAEWAYAARGPDRNIYPWGIEFDGLRLNYCDINCTHDWPDLTSDDGYEDTSPVGNYPSGKSWIGAYDMLGNVWEWVWDWHDYYPGHDWEAHPRSQAPNTYRVIRGGAWDTNRSHARNAFRNWFIPASYEDSIGFRCAMDAENIESTTSKALP